MLQLPWTVSTLAIEAGKYLIENHIEVIPDKAAYLKESARLHDALNAIPGLMLMDSDTNFMLAYMERSSASRLKQWLIDNYGILIRDASNFHGLDNRCFRVSAQRPEENNMLIAAIEKYMRQPLRPQ